jgi:hypothetical protein
MDSKTVPTGQVAGVHQQGNCAIDLPGDSLVILNAMKDLAPDSKLLDPSTSLRMTV